MFMRKIEIKDTNPVYKVCKRIKDLFEAGLLLVTVVGLLCLPTMLAASFWVLVIYLAAKLFHAL